MASPTTCPQCGAVLRLPQYDDPAVPHYTCPRCQANVPIPGRVTLPSPVSTEPQPAERTYGAEGSPASGGVPDVRLNKGGFGPGTLAVIAMSVVVAAVILMFAVCGRG
jgi:hypothetical protein